MHILIGFAIFGSHFLAILKIAKTFFKFLPPKKLIFFKKNNRLIQSIALTNCRAKLTKNNVKKKFSFSEKQSCKRIVFDLYKNTKFDPFRKKSGLIIILTRLSLFTSQSFICSVKISFRFTGFQIVTSRINYYF